MGGWIDGGGGVLFPLIGISDTDSSNWLSIDWNENDSADRTLNLLVGGGNRSLTINGDATLNDWFDQSVKQAGSPTFAGLTLTGLSGVLKATTGVVSGSATKSDIGLSNVENTALSTWAGSANITTLGTISTGTWSGTAIAVNKGGTGLTSYAVGDLVYASATGTLAGLADVAAGSYLASGGVNTAPSWATLNASAVGLGSVENTALSTWAGSANITTLGTISTGTWSGTTIAVNKGGTGLTSYAVGDLLYASAGTTITGLTAVATGQVLVSAGTTTAPAWSAKPNLTTVTFGTIYANGDSGNSITIDWGNGQKQSITLTGAPCTFTFTAPAGCGNFLLKVTQGTGGSKTATWPGTVKWPGGTAPTLSTTAADIDIVSFFYDGTNYYGSSSLDFS